MAKPQLPHWWRRLTRAFVSAVAVLFLLAPAATALTLSEIIELSKTGVSDEVLVALIEVDGTAWNLTPEQVIELKKAGVSEAVLLALVSSGRAAPQDVYQEPPAPEVLPYEEPQVTVVPAPPEPYAYPPGGPVLVEHYETVVPVPVFVNVPDKSHGRVKRDWKSASRKHHGRDRDAHDGRRPGHGRDDDSAERSSSSSHREFKRGPGYASNRKSK